MIENGYEERPLQSPGKLLTVVVPTLNSAATLDWTLASLSADCTIRVVVADSFSTDGTKDICKRWNVEVINVPAGNMYKAVNAGLRLAQTDWLGYVNSDDFVFPDAYQRMHGRAEQSSADIVYGSADYVDVSGRFIFSFRAAPTRSATKILRVGSMPFCQPAAIFRRTVFEKLNGFDERYRSAGDFDFYCRAAKMNLTFERFGVQPVVAFRLHKNHLGAHHPDWDGDERKDINERLHLDSGFSGRWARSIWSLSNTARYAARVVRSYDLFGRLSFQRSSTPPSYE